MSLLMDERLMKPENIAHGYDLFTGKSDSEIHHLGKIHMGDAWEPARQRFCGDNLHSMPIGLIVFADKSHLDLHGTLSILPTIFTLSCSMSNQEIAPFSSLSIINTIAAIMVSTVTE